MKPSVYILNSPDHPKEHDFNLFPVWCEWNDAEEIPYLKSLCKDESEYQERIIIPYQEGKETYYPLIEENLPARTYLMIKVAVEIENSVKLDGYVSTVDDEIVAICLWVNPKTNKEINLLSKSRMMAEEENPIALNELSKFTSSTSVSKIYFDSNIYLSNGKKVNGVFEI